MGGAARHFRPYRAIIEENGTVFRHGKHLNGGSTPYSFERVGSAAFHSLPRRAIVMEDGPAFSCGKDVISGASPYTHEEVLGRVALHFSPFKPIIMEDDVSHSEQIVRGTSPYIQKNMGRSLSHFLPAGSIIMENGPVETYDKHVTSGGSPHACEKMGGASHHSRPHTAVVMKNGAVITDCEHVALRNSPYIRETPAHPFDPHFRPIRAIVIKDGTFLSHGKRVPRLTNPYAAEVLRDCFSVRHFCPRGIIHRPHRAGAGFGLYHRAGLLGGSVAGVLHQHFNLILPIVQIHLHAEGDFIRVIWIVG